jgi:hypothetical protein
VIIAFPGERSILDGGGTLVELLILNQHASFLRFSGFILRNFTFWRHELQAHRGNRFLMENNGFFFQIDRDFVLESNVDFMDLIRNMP